MQNRQEEGIVLVANSGMTVEMIPDGGIVLIGTNGGRVGVPDDLNSVIDPGVILPCLNPSLSQWTSGWPCWRSLFSLNDAG